MTTRLNLAFHHPNTGSTFRANVAPACTAQIAIDALIGAKFLDPTSDDQPYGIAKLGTDVILPPTMTMAEAGVRDDDMLEVRRLSRFA